MSHAVIAGPDTRDITQSAVTLREHSCGFLAAAAAHTEVVAGAFLATDVFAEFLYDKLKDEITTFGIVSILRNSSR